MDNESQSYEDNDEYENNNMRFKGDSYAEARVDQELNEENEDRDLFSSHRDESQCLSESTEDVATSIHGVDLERRTLSTASQISGNSYHHVRRVSETPTSVQSHTVSRQHVSENSEHARGSATHSTRRLTSTVRGEKQNEDRDMSTSYRDDVALMEILREIQESHENVATSSHGVNLGRPTLSPASQNSEIDHRVRQVSETPSRTVSRNYVPENSERARGSATHSTCRLTSGVRGVPRLRTFRPRGQREEITEITNVNQLFNDTGEETEAPRHQEARSSALARTANETGVNRVERDRSNLRHVSAIKILEFKCVEFSNSFVFCLLLLV